MIKVGLIPCQNGLGHISRSVVLAEKLSVKYKIFFLTNLNKLNKFKLKKSIKRIHFISQFDLKKKNYNQFWYKKIEQKIKRLNLDILISDNLPEIVFLKNKSIIISNFFWHEIFNIKNEKLKKTLNLINKKKVKIFRNRIFKNHKNFSNIGFIGNMVNKYPKYKKGLLISFGSEDQINNSISNDLKKIIYDKNRKIPIFLDPNYFKPKYKKLNVRLATYNQSMFDKIKYAIIKPGFGSLYDCLKNQIIIFCYSNKVYNKEFKINSKAMKKNNLGYQTKNILASYKFIKKNKFLKLKKINKNMWNGEKKIIEYIDQLKLNKIKIMGK